MAQEWVTRGEECFKGKKHLAMLVIFLGFIYFSERMNL